MKIKNPAVIRFQSKNFRFFFILAFFCLITQTAAAQTGKRPIIVIPGITGSQIINTETKKPVWFTIKFSRDEPDDLRLPLSTDFRSNRDKLTANDIIREVRLPGILKFLPEIGVYGDALKAIETKGYTEGDWNNPKAEDVYYVFAYDWRRDNVENAQLLINKIEALKTKLKRSDLKFNVVAHSMGGLIARYAAMYGKADLPPARRIPRPTWAGARHFNKLLLFGTPNQGSFAAFEVLIKGYSIAGRKLPFVRDLSPEDVFSIPSIYQLLPTNAEARFLNENLQPMRVDLYNPANWRKYDWGAISSPEFLGKLKDASMIPGVKPVNWKIKNVDDKILSETTYAQAYRFLTAALNRARRFHQALDVNLKNSPIDILAYGSECEPTLDAVILDYDKDKKQWQTITEPKEIEAAGGRKISKEQVAKAIFSEGDGRVTRMSLLPVLGVPLKTTKAVAQMLFPVKSSFFFCSEHQKLLNDPTIQINYLTELASEISETNISK